MSPHPIFLCTFLNLSIPANSRPLLIHVYIILTNFMLLATILDSNCFQIERRGFDPLYRTFLYGEPNLFKQIINRWVAFASFWNNSIFFAPILDPRFWNNVFKSKVGVVTRHFQYFPDWNQCLNPIFKSHLSFSWF